MDNQPMSSMDVESQERCEYTDNNANAKALCISVVICIPVVVCALVLCFYLMPDEHYSVAIDSASALDPRTGVSFNLTLGVFSRSGAEACIRPGMYVEVLYRGVKVATSNPAETRKTCAKARKEAAEPVVARATVVPVGDVQDSLAAEMLQGAAVFDLRWIIQTTRGYRAYELVSGCKASRVGDRAVPVGLVPPPIQVEIYEHEYYGTNQSWILCQ
jgi:hypothetical protein